MKRTLEPGTQCKPVHTLRHPLTAMQNNDSNAEN